MGRVDLQFTGGCDRCRSIPAQQRADAAEQFHHTERLGYIVVAACIQTAYHIELLILGGEEQDGRCDALIAPFLTQGYAIAIGEGDVKDDQVNIDREVLSSLRSIGCSGNGITFTGK